MLALDRNTGKLSHASIRDLPSFLRLGDVLVTNDTRVFPARLLGRRVPSGGAVECLVLSEQRGAGREAREGAAATEVWLALMHPGQKLKPGARVVFEGGGTTLQGEVLDRHFHGR